jgi:hypothetical protein
MCYLCLSDNPFAIPNTHAGMSLKQKKERAALIKELLKDLETYNACVDGEKEIEELKEEQYSLSRDI